MNEFQFQEFLKTLEGFKIKFREFHWNAVTLSAHRLCDDIIDNINEHQDNIAEEGFTVFGKFGPDIFFPTQNFSSDIKSGLNELLSNLIELRTIISNENELVSIAAILDEFIHDVRKFIYLSDLN
jgi:hypothetical protein